MPRFLKQQYRTWYAVLEVPKPLRRKLGKARFKQSLKTDSLKVAEVRVLPVVAGWKRLIELARTGSDDLESQVAKLRKDIEVERKRGLSEEDIRGLSVLAFHTPPYVPNSEQANEEGLLVHSLAFDDEHLLSEHIDAYMATQTGIAPKSRDMKERDVRQFAKKFRFAHDADRLSLIAWVENELMGGRGLSEKTCRRMISNCRGYWEYLERHKKLSLAKPFDGIVPAKKRQKSASEGLRRAFGVADYQKLMAGVPERDESLRDLIRLGAYTGCRIEELCSLRLDQVQDDRLKIEDAKTEAGHRTVPIHSEILGRVHELRELSKDGYLLSGLTNNKYGDRSNAIGKRFGRLKSSVGYGRQYVFHSFRKGVASQLEQNGIPENEAARLLGHDLQTMSYGLYADGNIPFQRLKKIVEVLKWKNLAP